MAIAFDAYTTNDNTNWASATSATWSHTCSGANRILFVGVFDQGSGIEPSGITYAGVALTKIVGLDIGGGGFRNSLWYLIAPSTGANNVVVTFAVSNGLFNCGALSYTGAGQSSQPNTFGSNSNTSGTTLTTTITTTEDNCWTVGMASSTTATISGGTNAVVRSGALPGSLFYFDSNAALTPAGSKNVTINHTSGASNKGMVVAAFGPPGVSLVKTFNGLARSSTKTVNGLALASVKTWNGLA